MTMSNLQRLTETVAPVARPDGTDYAGDVRTVSTNAELRSAFLSMADGGGGIIELEASDERFDLRVSDRGDLTENAPILIRSADPGDRAVFSGASFSHYENISIEGVDFYGTREDPSNVLLTVYGGENIGLYDTRLSSNADGPVGVTSGPLSGAIKGSTGIDFHDSIGVTVAGNTFEDLYHGISILNTSQARFVGNEVTQIQGDALRLGGVQDVEIAANWMHDFRGSTQSANHSDMIQLWGGWTKQNTERLTIANNFLDVGEGPAYQMIFGRNEHKHLNGWLYEDILVEGNVIRGGMHQLIGIYDTKDMVIRNNAVIQLGEDFNVTKSGYGPETGEASGWIRSTSSVNATVENNIAPKYIGANGGDNVVLDPKEMKVLFANIANGVQGDLRDLMIRPDTDLDGAYGSPLLWWGPTERLEALSVPSASVTDTSVITLDAGLSANSGGRLGDAASYEWSFADGSVKTGRVVTHDFGDPGRHDYTLKVTDAAGDTDVIDRQVIVENPVLFDLEIVRGRPVNAADRGMAIDGLVRRIVEDDGLRIGSGTVPTINRTEGAFYDLGAFTFEMTIDPAEGSYGRFLDLPRSLTARVERNGAVSFQMTNAEGKFAVETPGGQFDDGPRHVAIAYDSAEESLAIYVDGELLAEETARGLTKPLEHWGLSFGRVWGGSVDAKLTDIKLFKENMMSDDAEVPEPQPKPEPTPKPTPEPEPEFDAEILGSTDFEGDLPEGLSIRSGGITEDRFGDGGIDIRTTTLAVDRDQPWLYDAEGFDIAFDVSVLTPGTSGHILHLPRAMDATLDADGRLSLSLETTEGEATAVTQPGVLVDGEVHRLNFGYDATEGLLRILVDGETAASAELTGETLPKVHWGLTFGHQWRGATADLRIDDVAIADGFMSGGKGAEPVPAPEPEVDRRIFDIDFEEGFANQANTGVEVRQSRNSDLEIFGGVGRFDGGDSLFVDRSTEDLFGRDSFEFKVDLSTEDSGSHRVLGIHGSMRLEVRDDDLVFSLWNDEGDFVVKSDGDVMADGAMHAVRVGYDAGMETLALFVDDTLVDSVEASGHTAEKLYWGLNIGSPWGGSLRGEMDRLVMSEGPQWTEADLLM